MALRVADNTGQHVSHGSDTSLDDINEGSILVWVYVRDVADAFRVAINKAGVGVTTMYRPAAGMTNPGSSIRWEKDRATTDLRIWTVGSVITANEWNCIAFAWNTGGADGDQKCFVGVRGGEMSEPSYNTQSAGSGAVTSDAASALQVGCNSGAASSAPWDWGIVNLISGRRITLAEAQAWMYQPRPLTGSVLFTLYGHNGTSAQADLSGSNNHGSPANSPTVAPTFLPLGYPLAFGAGGGALGQALQCLRPGADVQRDGWTDEGGASTDLYQSIDEAVPSAADYIISP